MVVIDSFNGRGRTALQAFFGVAIVAAFVVAVSPAAIQGGPSQTDKIAHGLAFYGLALFGAIAMPRKNLIIMGLSLSAYGALIEVVQGLPLVGRDADLWDWIADTAGILMAFSPLALARWRMA